MPFGNRTGPRGEGPLTGRGAGYCAGYAAPGYASWGPGRGVGYAGAWGRGRGHRHWYYATGLPGWLRGGYAPSRAPGPYATPMTAAQEASILEERVRAVQEELEALSERLEALRQARTSGQHGEGG